MGFLDSYKAAKAAPEKSPGMTVAIGVGKPGDAGPDEKPDDALNPEETAASHSAMAAIQGGDTVAFGRAMKAFLMACEPDGDEAEPASATVEPMPK